MAEGSGAVLLSELLHTEASLDIITYADAIIHKMSNIAP